MPESRGRRRSVFTPPPARGSGVVRPNPRWWVPVMLGLMLLGLLWIVVYYLSEGKYPLPDVGVMNLVAGFVVLLVGFGMTTRWR